MKRRLIIGLAASVVLCFEAVWLTGYLAVAVEPGDEALGAVFLVTGTIMMFLGFWRSLRLGRQRHGKDSAVLLFLSALLFLYLAYVFLTRYW